MNLHEPKKFASVAQRWFGWVVLGLVALLICPGCTTRKSMQMEVRRAYEAGFDAGKAAAQAMQTHVFVFGPVERQQILWHPALTVAQAIVEAVYTAPNDPRSIIVTRDGEENHIAPEDLLRGIDFELQPGDSIRLIP